MKTIAEIAAELAGHGANAHASALTTIDFLRFRSDLDDAGRWQETLKVLAAMDLVREQRVRFALGEYDDPA